MSVRPYTVIFSTMTLDGRIASSIRYSLLSCNYDFARLQLLRGAADAVMVGANTAIIDDPSLRKRIRPSSNKYYRVVVDGMLRIPVTLRLVSYYPKTIVFTAVNDQLKIRLLKSRGVEVHIVGRDGKVDLEEALKILAENYAVRKLLVEGGGTLNYSLLSRRLVDEVRVTITPYVFASGVSVFQDPLGRGFPTVRDSPRLKLVCSEMCPCQRCLHLVYKVEDARGIVAARELIAYCLSKELIFLNLYLLRF
jgi:2,5-diamino-6-(ribosylamino)-4(3H)-pyrimidinone 5'-phosphate reductase